MITEKKTTLICKVNGVFSSKHFSSQWKRGKRLTKPNRKLKIENQETHYETKSDSINERVFLKVLQTNNFRLSGFHSFEWCVTSLSSSELILLFFSMLTHFRITMRQNAFTFAYTFIETASELALPFF